MQNKSAEAFLPLTPLWFNILLSAADGPTHGYAVAKEIEERTGGTLTPGTGTVYVALQRLVQEGLLEETQEGSKAYDDRRDRRHYTLSELGRSVCTAEANRLLTEIRVAIDKRILRGLEPGLDAS